MKRPALDVLTRPGASETIALDAEIGDLIERIDHPQLSIEFQAIDNSHLVSEPDMFRPKIAVSVHDSAPARATGNDS
jgi:hypothetical protein